MSESFPGPGSNPEEQRPEYWYPVEGASDDNERAQRLEEFEEEMKRRTEEAAKKAEERRASHTKNEGDESVLSGEGQNNSEGSLNPEVVSEELKRLGVRLEELEDVPDSVSSRDMGTWKE